MLFSRSVVSWRRAACLPPRIAGMDESAVRIAGPRETGGHPARPGHDRCETIIGMPKKRIN
ncbi:MULTISPECIES: hypothetical protein [Burkholderia]|uniref:hypothetical protein n=1 Tax=Burkholderia TaxID=32008 RepID=UPI00126A2B67|nr:MULTISPECIES: hypothetical protein [Burkholderia]